MSLPAILKFVYNHGTEEVVRRGKKIFYSSGVQMLDVDHLIEQVRFRVRNDLYQNYYTVTINKYLTTADLSVRCQCPYNLGEICRHEVAALFQLNDIIQSGFFENMDVSYEQKHTIVRMRQVSKQVLQIFTPPDAIDQAEDWAAENRAVIKSGKNEKIEADIVDGKKTYHLIIKQNEERYFDTSCQCQETRFPLCVHKTTLFLQLLKKHGPEYFQAMQNWDVQKNKLLEQYGYSLNDDLKGKFMFQYENGKPFLRVLDPTIKKVAVAPQPVKVEAVEIPVVVHDQKNLGLALDTGLARFPYVDILLIAGTTDESEQRLVGKIEKLELQQYINPMRFKEADRDLLPVVRKFIQEELIKYLRKNLPFGDFLPEHDNILSNVPPPDVREQLWEYLLPKYQKLLSRYSALPLIYLKKEGRPVSAAGMEEIAFSDTLVHPQLEVKIVDGIYRVNLEWIIESTAVAYNEVSALNAALVIHNSKVYALSTLNEVSLAETFQPDGEITVKADQWPDFLKDKIMGWSKKVHVHFSEEILERIEGVKPSKILYLQEKENMFIMQPAFSYEGIEINGSYFGDVIQPHDGIVKIVQRNEVAENDFFEDLQGLHTDVLYNKKEHFYYLPGSAVLSNNWFFRFTDQVKEWGVELRGFEKLKNLRVNTHKAETLVQVTSGIDWFDASVELTFGDQKVSIIEVKKAIAAKQNFVRLGDGSMGMLPDD